MLRTLSSRLVVTHLVVAVVAIGLVGVLSSLLFRYYYVARSEASMKAAATDLAVMLGGVMTRPKSEEGVLNVTRAAKSLLGEQGKVCVFRGTRNDLVASSEPSAATVGSPPGSALECEAQACAKIENTQVKCYPGLVISAVAPIEVPGTHEHIGVLLLRRPVSEVEETLGRLSLLVGLSGVVAAGLALLLGVALTRALARPLADMAQVASEIAGGDFTARAQRQGPAELRTVAASLNRMAGELATAFAQLSGERERLADILASMEEGVVSLDAAGGVVLANDSARRLLALAPQEGPRQEQRLEELLGDGAGPLTPVLAGQRDSSEFAAEVRGRKLRLHASRIRSGEGGAVVVVADVTEAERLERLRREFVANASHELRAPLTSIQGFLGAISDGTAATEEEKLRCVRVAGQQADTMRRLVDQLLDLSRLQAGAAPMQPERLDLGAVLAGAQEAMSPQATDKDVRVELVADALPAVWADGDRLMQVAINLLDNAIRYSPQGGEVRVVAGAEGQGPGQQVVVSVSDQGPGIPAEDLPLIWERFHKADRSRSRSEAGTGLGLSIAREIILAHGGQVRAENALTGGAVISVTIPVNPLFSENVA